LERWHWVYTAARFRLDHRCVRTLQNQRARLITERSYTPRAAVPALMQQLYYEARARLAQAQRVLVLADGAL
jgi:hypothetical protein